MVSGYWWIATSLAGKVRDQFFDKIRSLGINRLDVLCLTHPHHDHFRGMGDVVDYFTSQGRSLGIFCDSGVDPHQIIAAIKRANVSPPSLVREHEKLYEKLNDLFLAKRVRYFQGNRDSNYLIRHGPNIYLTPVGPSSEIVRSTALQAIGEGNWTSALRKRLNQLSLVLALCVREKGAALDALLAADTDGEGFNEACNALMEIQGISKCAFDLVKVAHHGSLDSHQGSTVCKLAKTGSPLAVICCDGENPKLPDREVIRAFLNAGWTVLPTSRRLRKRENTDGLSSPLMLAGYQPKKVRSSVESDDIQVTWSEVDGVRYSPGTAAVREEDLANYGTAQSASRDAATADDPTKAFVLI